MMNFTEHYMNESKNVWYHGTPDSREIEKGGFVTKTQNIEYIKDPEEYEQFKQNLDSAYKDDKDEYFKLLDKGKDFRKMYKINIPIFLTNKYNVAKTYADPSRAFDYQGAEEKVYEVNSSPGKNVKIMAVGDRFRFINTDKVKKGFVSAGVSGDEFDKVLKMFNFAVRNKKGITTDIIGAIGQWFGFDTIDVNGVLDSYHGGTTQSNVRMVLDPKNIKIKKEEDYE